MKDQKKSPIAKLKKNINAVKKLNKSKDLPETEGVHGRDDYRRQIEIDCMP